MSENIFSSNIYIADNSGYGGTQPPISIVSSILLAAIDICVLEKGKLDKSAIEINLHKTLEDFISFIKGNEISEPHLIGFSGFSTRKDTQIGFGNLNAFPLNDLQTNYFFGENKKIGLIVKETFRRKKNI